MGDNLNGIFANMIQGMGFIGCAPNRVYNMAPPNGGGVEATAEGTELTLHSTAASLTALTLYGKSEQRTTTGAQLISLNDSYGVTTVNGVTKTPIGISAWKLEGIPKDDAIFYPYSSSNFLSLSKGDYVFSVFGTSKAKARYTIIGGGSSAYIQAGYSQKISIQEDVKLTLNFLIENGVESNGILMIMLNSGSTSLPWEPYTGGAPSPSPSYPQEIKSVGDSGTINITLSDGGSQSQTIPVQTPNGLPGIPVDSGGNYTDADGQQWVCNYRDYARGVDVQCVEQRHITSDDAITLGSIGDGVNNRFQLNLRNNFDVKPFDKYNIGVSNYFQAENTSGILGENKFRITYTGGTTYILFNISTDIVPLEDIDAFKAWLSEHDLIVYYMIAPVETPIPPEEIAAYAALRTYSPTTVVSNDAGAWMNVGYKATPQPMTMLARKR